MIQYRHTTSLLLILMTALQSMLPCACQACESAICCGVSDHKESPVDGSHPHCHKIDCTTTSDEAAPAPETRPTSGHHHGSAPAVPVKSCRCIRCVSVGTEVVRLPQRLKVAAPYHAGNVEDAISPTTASNALTFGVRNALRCALARERALVRLQV